MNNLMDSIQKPGTYKRRIFKGDEELGRISDKVVKLLLDEGLPVWQTKEVLKLAANEIEWQILR